MKGLLLDLLKALILGILQGATEFLPISSSGHLVLVPWWLGWDKPPLVFDVVVHLGTLVAVLMYFWRDWLTLLQAGFRVLQKRTLSDLEPDARLLLLLVVGTLPAAVIGVLLEAVFEAAFAEPRAAAAFLLLTAALLVFSERRYTAHRTLHDLTPVDALIVGVTQAFAIFPGISRSGSTIAAGITRGLSRPLAARFSFLLATPIIMGAGAKQVLDVLIGDVTVGRDLVGALGVGFVAAAVVGYASIWFLMRLIQARRLYGFAAYCAVFGTVSLLVALFM
ncbi:MAG: undecaprenyl-diphosphate phosphatase [Anaerolineae bacterium]|nr:undecaprenyl-diphosphate phosphatase [Anaerolineae bacterium]